jgi:hypothetical protein
MAADRQWIAPVIPPRDARRNCLNLKGVMAIKLVAAPRYHIYDGLPPATLLNAGVRRVNTSHKRAT